MLQTSRPVSPIILLVCSVDGDGAAWLAEFPHFEGIVQLVRVDDAKFALRGRRLATLYSTTTARRCRGYLGAIAMGSRGILITHNPALVL